MRLLNNQLPAGLVLIFDGELAVQIDEQLAGWIIRDVEQLARFVPIGIAGHHQRSGGHRRNQGEPANPFGLHGKFQ
jgi:hypothetical protein